ncbi:Xylulose kinase [Raoultella terrigena]|uniref:Xylulose kinase n=1 Tax=Raoultella terrigena TaxID=577 RepID=A0A3P8KAZ9_RAOTE|nr:Xylulose kinase [Raoultella terrigena]
MYLGIDLGTSEVKALVIDENNDVVASHSAPLSIQRPHPTGQNRRRRRGGKPRNI